MRFTLITPTGRVYTFFIEALAKTYQQAYGGTLMTNDVLVNEDVQTVV